MRVLVGLGLCFATWSLVLRRGAGARALWTARPLAAGLDVAPILLGFAAVLGATARPVLSGLVIAAAAAGLSVADRVKRIVLDEPVVFADRAELLEVLRHPSLYLPFAGSAWVLGAAASAVAALGLLLAWAEPAIWSRSVPTAMAEAALAAALAYGCFAVPAAWPSLLRGISALYTRRLAPSRDPGLDSAAFGPLACFAVHATLAAAERPGRRIAAAANPGWPQLPGDACPIVLIQAESFFDPARLHPALAGMLPHFERLAAAAAQRGQLAVPAWGANTVRTEFAVLTGLSEDALGLDRFNPYEAFAQAAGPMLPSLVRAAKAAGYHTVFVHPFDLRFYGRSRVMPLLGFDELVGPEAFATAGRRGDWVADEAVADAVVAVLRRHGSRVFIFAATMEAHGPWANTPNAAQCVSLPAPVATLPEAAQVAQWLWHLQGTDRLMQIVSEALRELGRGWLAVYGDHQPSLPATFAAAGLTDRRTDYFIWDAAASARPGCHGDLDASSLGTTMMSVVTAAGSAGSGAYEPDKTEGATR